MYSWIVLETIFAMMCCDDDDDDVSEEDSEDDDRGCWLLKQKFLCSTCLLCSQKPPSSRFPRGRALSRSCKKYQNQMFTSKERETKNKSESEQIDLFTRRETSIYDQLYRSMFLFFCGSGNVPATLLAQLILIKTDFQAFTTNLPFIQRKMCHWLLFF